MHGQQNIKYYNLMGLPSRGRDSSVGIATRYGLDGPGIENKKILVGGEIFCTRPDQPVRAHPASNTLGTVSFPGVKRPRHGVDHLPHLAPRLKKE
jgi:hypothetical protein